MILIAVIGFSFAANAQMCQPTGNVESSIREGNCRETGTQEKCVYIDLVNTNDYKVTVVMEAEIVAKTDSAKKTVKRTVVINPPKVGCNDIGNKKTIKTLILWDSADIDASSVNLSVSKCD